MLPTLLFLATPISPPSMPLATPPHPPGRWAEALLVAPAGA
jgi:hypothetical protein